MKPPADILRMYRDMFLDAGVADVDGSVEMKVVMGEQFHTALMEALALGADAIEQGARRAN